MSRDIQECCIKGCESTVRNQCFCTYHYHQWNRYGHPLAGEIKGISHKKRSTGNPTYNTWVSMKKRCNDTRAKNYVSYGAKGIKVCDRWQTSFLNFYEDMGERPEGKSIDRIDNNKGYEPDNCRWATVLEQAHNKSGTLLNDVLVLDLRNKYYSGVKVRELSNMTGVDYQTIYCAVTGKSWKHLNDNRTSR